MFLRAAVAVVLAALFCYGCLEAWPLVSGPALAITSPQDGQTVADGVLAVSGTAKRIVALSLDGVPVLPDGQGNFSETITLPRGGAILSFRATDRFGRTITRSLSVYAP